MKKIIMYALSLFVLASTGLFAQVNDDGFSKSKLGSGSSDFDKEPTEDWIFEGWEKPKPNPRIDNIWDTPTKSRAEIQKEKDEEAKPYEEAHRKKREAAEKRMEEERKKREGTNKGNEKTDDSTTPKQPEKNKTPKPKKPERKPTPPDNPLKKQ